MHNAPWFSFAIKTGYLKRLCHRAGALFSCRFRSMAELLICNQRTRVRFPQTAPSSLLLQTMLFQASFYGCFGAVHPHSPQFVSMSNALQKGKQSVKRVCPKKRAPIHNESALFFIMQEKGVEPSLRWNWCLKPARLPFRHSCTRTTDYSNKIRRKSQLPE